MNKTVEAILRRLPRKDILGPGDLSNAFGFGSAFAIIHAIQCGEIDATKIGGRYIISRDAAEAYIRKSAIVSDERKTVK